MVRGTLVGQVDMMQQPQFCRILSWGSENGKNVAHNRGGNVMGKTPTPPAGHSWRPSLHVHVWRHESQWPLVSAIFFNPLRLRNRTLARCSGQRAWPCLSPHAQPFFSPCSCFRGTQDPVALSPPAQALFLVASGVWKAGCGRIPSGWVHSCTSTLHALHRSIS